MAVKKKPKKKVSSTDLGMRVSAKRSPVPGVGKAIRRPSPQPIRTPVKKVVTKPVAPPAAPYDPVAAMTPGQIDARAHQLAMSQVQPELDLVGQESARLGSAHKERDAELQGWYGAQQNELNKAFSDTQFALDKMLANSATSGQQGQDALAAALRSFGTGSSDLARMTGVTAPAGESPELLAGHAASVAPMREQLLNASLAQLGAQGQRRSLAGIGGVQAYDQERRRFGAQDRELALRRQQATGRIPGLETEARTGLEARELDKYKTREDLNLAKKKFGEDRANRLFQQWLAKRELGLKEKGQSFDQWLQSQNLNLEKSKFAEQTQIDWANVGINRTQAEAQLRQVDAEVKNAKDGDAKEKAKLKREALAKGLEWLNGFMAHDPKTEAAPSSATSRYPVGPQPTQDDVTSDGAPKNQYVRRYNDALAGLQSQGLSKSDALRLLMNSTYTDWKRRARQEYQRMKRRGPYGSATAQPTPSKGMPRRKKK